MQEGYHHELCPPFLCRLRHLGDLDDGRRRCHRPEGAGHFVREFPVARPGHAWNPTYHLRSAARTPARQPNTPGNPRRRCVHGSAGIDSRGNYYEQALNDAGIATLEIDMWAARNLTGGADRPALPSLTVPDAFSALKYLADNPAIDANRIGVLGFSWGGVVSLLSATQYYTAQFGDGHAFAAHVANYPVCWAYSAGIPGIFFSDLTGAPVLVQVGNHDDYDDGPAAGCWLHLSTTYPLRCIQTPITAGTGCSPR